MEPDALGIYRWCRISGRVSGGQRNFASQSALLVALKIGMVCQPILDCHFGAWNLLRSRPGNSSLGQWFGDPGDDGRRHPVLLRGSATSAVVAAEAW